jgi:tRNA dimethylallyltransferase
MIKQKTCIIICGPTASGKTDIAIQVAQYFHTQIISADSRQCFNELNIAVAKPNPEQLSSVQHYFINTHSIHEIFSAADYEKYALTAADVIFAKNNIAVVCGGTGLYIKAFCEGLDDIPSIDESIKKGIIESYELYGISWLQQQIKFEDELYYAKGEIQNPQRMIRALEVIRGTGKSIVLHQQKIKKQRDFNIVKIGIDIERQFLYNRINARVDKMLLDGLEDEARSLLPHKSLNALQTVGYRELFDYFEGLISKEKAIELIKQNTRHYAKRQVTWFKKDEDVIWLPPEQIVHYVKENFLKTSHQL